MTGTAVDTPLVLAATNEHVNRDKIAEAEALAAEALRMANEAKKAAERLAEVKKTLAMFSRKLDKVEKAVVFEAVAKIDDVIAFDIEKYDKVEPEPVAPIDAPVEEKEPAEETKNVKEVPPPVEEDEIKEEELVPPPSPTPAAPVKDLAVVSDKDVLEATLDHWGLDKGCGVDEVTLARAEAEEPRRATPVVEAATRIPKKEEPVEEKIKEPIEEEVKESIAVEMPPPVQEEEEHCVPPVQKVEEQRVPSLPPTTPDQHSVIVSEKERAIIAKKDVLEATLDRWGVDKACGVDEMTISQIQEDEMFHSTHVVKKVVPATKTVEFVKKVAAPAATTKAVHVAPAPVMHKVEQQHPASETKVVVLDDDAGKDLLEKTLDSWGVDRLCGVDDYSLGLRNTPFELPPPPPPKPFENPTRVEYKAAPPLEIVHSESLKDKESKTIRKQQQLPQKYYQRAPTNYDFVDPFGVDHDDFAMCGRIADTCDPNFELVEQPRTYTIDTTPVPVTHGEPEKSILKKQEDMQPVPAAEGSPKNVSFRQESPYDKRDP